MGKKQFCFFQTAETGNRTPNSGVKGSGSNHYPRAPAHLSTNTNLAVSTVEQETNLVRDHNMTPGKAAMFVLLSPIVNSVFYVDHEKGCLCSFYLRQTTAHKLSVDCVVGETLLWMCMHL